MAFFSGKEASDMWESWLGFQSLDHFSLLSKWRSTFFPGNSPGQTEPRRPVAAPRCGGGGGGRGAASSRPPDSGLEGLAVAPEPEVSSWLCREPPQSDIRLAVPDGPRSASGLAGLVLKSPSLLSH